MVTPHCISAHESGSKERPASWPSKPRAEGGSRSCALNTEPAPAAFPWLSFLHGLDFASAFPRLYISRVGHIVLLLHVLIQIHISRQASACLCCIARISTRSFPDFALAYQDV